MICISSFKKEKKENDIITSSITNTNKDKDKDKNEIKKILLSDIYFRISFL